MIGQNGLNGALKCCVINVGDLSCKDSPLISTTRFGGWNWAEKARDEMGCREGGMKGVYVDGEHHATMSECIE